MHLSLVCDCFWSRLLYGFIYSNYHTTDLSGYKGKDFHFSVLPSAREGKSGIVDQLAEPHLKFILDQLPFYFTARGAIDKDVLDTISAGVVNGLSFSAAAAMLKEVQVRMKGSPWLGYPTPDSLPLGLSVLCSLYGEQCCALSAGNVLPAVQSCLQGSRGVPGVSEGNGKRQESTGLFCTIGEETLWQARQEGCLQHLLHFWQLFVQGLAGGWC